MGGVGFQQLFIFVFAFIAYKFQREVRLSAPSDKRSKALQLLYVEYFVLTLITIRIIFRLIEYSQGLDSTIPNHEVYQYIFDSLPMFIALVVFNVFHPGRIMAGKKSDFPSRKERKNFVRRYSNDNISMRPIQDLSTYFPMPEEHAYQAKTEPLIPNYGYVK
ncbi:MAG: hypothetical protein Q9214_007822 [Letrouitia sp. 1 TL-2023]